MCDWQPIETAPKDAFIDVWCIPHDLEECQPLNGGVRLTEVHWHDGDETIPESGWCRVCDDGFVDFIEEGPSSECGLPPWKPVYWMPLPKPPNNV